MSGRNATFTISLEDKPGQLEQVAHIISKCGGNVVNVHYDHSETNTAINSCILTLVLETRDFEQINEIKTALEADGFNLV